VATLVSEEVDSETASQQLGHSSAAITKDFYIAKPPLAADVSHVLQSFAGEPASNTLPTRNGTATPTPTRPSAAPARPAPRALSGDVSVE
jgi:hypothetical protein